MKNSKILLMMFALLYFPFAFAKADRWYKVEVLVFETKDKAALTEDWTLEPGKPAIGEAVALVSDPASLFGKIPEQKLTLNDVKQKIQKNYHLVLHQGWRQTIADKATAPKVHVVGGKQYNTDAGATQNEVDGVIRLTSGTYLHVDADLLMHKPMKILSETPANGTGIAKFAEVANRSHWQSDPNARLQSFRLKGSNRIRANEIHYLDHPMYGVIIMVTPESAA
jgi:hypothetical protein